MERSRMTFDFLGPLYLWMKALHVASIIAWMAALFYLPRLYVYHCMTSPGSEGSERFKVMERRLLRQIAVPAMLATWISGLTLVATPGVIDWQQGWWHLKLFAVLLLTGFHFALMRWRHDFLDDRNTHTHVFYRFANELPTLLMLVIVVMVMVKPF
jgi:putative membrane protein